MDEVIDDIISMQSKYELQGFIDAVQMPNTVSELSAACVFSSVPDSRFQLKHDRCAATGLQLPLFYPSQTSKFSC